MTDRIEALKRELLALEIIPHGELAKLHPNDRFRLGPANVARIVAVMQAAMKGEG